MPDYKISAKIVGDSKSFEKAFETANRAVESFDAKFKGVINRLKLMGSSLNDSNKHLTDSSNHINKHISSFKEGFEEASRTVEDFDEVLSNVTGGLKNIGGSLTNVGGKLTKFVTKPAIGAVSALTGITLVKGFDRLTGIDDAKAKLMGLGHSADSVKSIMDSALKSVKGTSYGLDEAATTAAGAVAAGVKQGNELTRYLSLTADAAAEAGASMSDMGSIINKVQTSQVAYTDNLNMLADRGLPIYQWLADEAGTTAAAVKDMAKSGEISSDMFLNAIEKNIGGAAKIIGENSFKASIANVGASIGRIGANFLDAGGSGAGFFTTLKPLITDLTNDLGVIENKASALGEKFGESFKTIVDKVQEGREYLKSLSAEAQASALKTAGIGSVMAVGLGPGISALGKGMQAISKFSDTTSVIGKTVKLSFQNIPASLSSANTAISGFLGDFKNLGSGLLQPISPLLSKTSAVVNGTFGKIGAAISTPFKNGFTFIKSGVGDLVGSFGTKFPALTGIIGSFENNSSGMFSKIGGSISSILGRAAGFAPVFLKGFSIAAGLGVVFAGLGLLNQGFGDQIESLLNTVTEKGPYIITNLCNGISEKLPDLINQGGTLINNFLNAIIANVPALLSGGTEIITTLVNSVGNQLPTLIPTALQLILTLVDGLLYNLPKIVTTGLNLIVGLVGGLVKAIPKLIDAAPRLITNLITGICNMLPQIITTGITLITQLAVGLIQAIPELVKAVPKIIDELKSSFSNFDWGEIGRNIIDGIKNGLSSVASSLIQAAKDVGGQVLDGIKKTLGIHSPSRVFRDQVGKMMSIGLGIGFVKNLPVKAMTNGVSKAVSRINGNSFEMGATVGTSNMSSVTTHMIEDVSLNYGMAAAAASSANSSFDFEELGAYIITAVNGQAALMADALKDGVSAMKLVPRDREASRYIASIQLG